MLGVELTLLHSPNSEISSKQGQKVLNIKVISFWLAVYNIVFEVLFGLWIFTIHVTIEDFIFHHLNFSIV